MCTRAGSQYYRLSRPADGSSALLRADSGYPRPLSNWNLGLAGVGAAMKTASGNNYFFRQGSYYLYDSANYRVSAQASSQLFSDG